MFACCCCCCRLKIQRLGWLHYSHMGLCNESFPHLIYMIEINVDFQAINQNSVFSSSQFTTIHHTATKLNKKITKFTYKSHWISNVHFSGKRNIRVTHWKTYAQHNIEYLMYGLIHKIKKKRNIRVFLFQWKRKRRRMRRTIAYIHLRFNTFEYTKKQREKFGMSNNNIRHLNKNTRIHKALEKWTLSHSRHINDITMWKVC